MTLGERQEEFSWALGDLLVWAKSQGIRIRMGDVFDSDKDGGHRKDSNHYLKLAADLFIFRKGAKTQDMEAHKRMHNAWDALGGAPRIPDDMNHYSFEWKGRW